ncbi:hypothetical protein TOPH_07185, partial [Tolypocladium ophioglossoides CBS 100239]
RQILSRHDLSLLHPCRLVVNHLYHLRSYISPSSLCEQLIATCLPCDLHHSSQRSATPSPTWPVDPLLKPALNAFDQFPYAPCLAFPSWALCSALLPQTPPRWRIPINARMTSGAPFSTKSSFASSEKRARSLRVPESSTSTIPRMASTPAPAATRRSTRPTTSSSRAAGGRRTLTASPAQSPGTRTRRLAWRGRRLSAPTAAATWAMCSRARALRRRPMSGTASTASA